MTLGRPAKGLPRYYMDVGWHRHPKWAGVPVEALFVHTAAIGYCTEHNTDGVLPSDLEDLSLALGVRLSVVRKAVKALLAEPTGDHHRWVKVGDELVIVGYAEDNPVAVEVTEHSERQRSRGSFGNHKRWHVDRGKVEPGCPYCDSPGESPGDDPQATASPGESLGLGWDGLGEPPITRPPTDPGSDSPQQDDDGRVQAAVRLLAETDLQERRRVPGLDPVGDDVSWLRQATSRRAARNTTTLAALAGQDPDATPQQLVEALNGEGEPDVSDPSELELHARLDGLEQVLSAYSVDDLGDPPPDLLAERDELLTQLGLAPA